MSRNNHVFSSAGDDWINKTYTTNVGSEYATPNVRISPILDTDASRFLYEQRDDTYKRYNNYLKNTVGITKTINGELIMNDKRRDFPEADPVVNGEDIAKAIHPEMNFNSNRIRERMNEVKTKANDSLTKILNSNNKLFILDPLSLLDLSSIDLTSPDINIKINSIVKIGLLIWVSVYFTNNFTQYDDRTLIIIMIIGIIVILASKKSLKEKYIPTLSGIVPETERGPHYHPRDIDMSRGMVQRQFTPVKPNISNRDRDYVTSNIRY